MLDNPIASAALICFLLGLVLSGLARIDHGDRREATVVPGTQVDVPTLEAGPGITLDAAPQA